MATPVPLPRLAGLAAVGAVVVLGLPGAPWWPLVMVNAVLAGLAAIDLSRAAPPTRVVVHRRVPQVIGLGGEADLTWVVVNPTQRPAAVALADHPPPSLGAAARRVALAVPAGGTRSVSTTVRPRRRGRYRLGDVAVRTAGPWRLAARQATVAVPGVVRVYPAFASRRQAELRLDRARIAEVGLRSARGRGGGTEFERLRDYSPDDDHRHLDWAATARAGRPISREHRAERNQTVLVLVDTGRAMAARAGGEARLEHALDAAMAVATVAGRLGDRVGLVAYDAAVRTMVAPRARRDQVSVVTEGLHDLHPRLLESDHRAAFAATLARHRRRALLVVLTDLAEQVAAESLVPALPLVARDHVVVVAAVRDPVVGEWAAEPPATAAAAYRQAAALDALAERDRVAARLRGLGATVVDAEPGRLAGLVVDAYLDVKATGRL